MQLEVKEAELRGVQSDIERVKSYQDIAVQPSSLGKDLEEVKEFVK